MVHLVRKVVKGHVYLYLEKRERIDGKSQRAWQWYLGREDKVNPRDMIPLSGEFEITSLDFGLPVALMQIVKRLDLIAIIDSVVKKREQGWSVGEYIVLAALNRCIHPTTKAQIKNWFEWTYLGKYFPEITTYLDSMAYSNHFEYVTEDAIAAIEQKLHEKLIHEFKITMDTLMFDPTNFFTFINPGDDVDLPHHGHSKENRATLNLVGLSLVCTSDGGIPLLYDVYPGNEQDSIVFKDNFPRIEARLKSLKIDPARVILIFDKGNISEEGFELIDASKMQFIASIRPSTVKEFDSLTANDFTTVTLPNEKTIGVLEREHEYHGTIRRLIIVHDPNRCKWLSGNLLAKLEKKVTTINDYFETRLNKNKWQDREIVEAKVKNMVKTKAHLEWIEYSITGERGALALSVSVNHPKLEQHLDGLGKSYLITNVQGKTAAEVAWLFRQQYTIENAFKYLKNFKYVGVKPIYHRLDETIRGHVFSCVLGYLLLALLHREVAHDDVEMGIPAMVEALSNITISVIDTSGSKKPIKKINRMPPESKRLFDVLHLNEWT
ncbi:MAG TPA: IS1634 family transposase [Candidatus Lokiarchaeia archaeon]|nr:IS1634 family transposase [Candidatus Lokiarchaeia archaeon]